MKIHTALSCAAVAFLAATTVDAFAPLAPSFAKTTAAVPRKMPLFAVDRNDSATVDKTEEVMPAITTDMNVSKDFKEEKEEELSETQKLMKQVKDSGVAGIISYALWELGFWTISVPVCIFGYRELTGHWPDLSDSEDLQKVGAEAFAFVNFARFAVPLRIGLALSTTPWIQDNIVDKFLKKDGEE